MFSTLLMVFAALMLLAGLVAFFQSVRSVFGMRTRLDATDYTHFASRAALEDEKTSLLKSIKDLAFEREVGKIGHADFERINAAYRQRAKVVLRLLDEGIEPYLEEAQALLDGVAVAAENTVTQERSTRECPACGTVNDSDAKFCKNCAKPLLEQALSGDESPAQDEEE